MVLSLSFLIQTFLNSDRVHMKEESENDNFLMSSLPPRLRLELFAVSSSYMGEDMSQPRTCSSPPKRSHFLPPNPPTMFTSVFICVCV